MRKEPTEAEVREPARLLPFRWQQLFVVLAAILPLLALSALLLLWGIREHRQAVERGLENTARALATAVNEQLVTWRAALDALATSPTLLSGRFDEFYVQASSVAAQHGGAIVVFDRTLQQRINTLRPLGTPLPRARYSEPLRHVFSTGKAEVRGPFIGRVAQDWIITIDVPVLVEGEIVYDLNMFFPPAVLNELLASQNLPSGWVANIISGDQHKFVARSEGAAALIGITAPDWYIGAVADREAGIVKGPSPAGGPRQVLAFKRLREAPWILAVAVSESQLGAVWRWPFLIFGGLSLAAIVAATALAWVFSLRVTRPLEQLAGHAGNMLQGRTPPSAPSRILELETLRRALEQAAAHARGVIAAEERLAAAEDGAAKLREGEMRERLLRREVDHRAKNLLAVVQAILKLTHAEDAAGYASAVTGRIMALAQAHSLLSASQWEGVDLQHILQFELAPYRTEENRIEIDGPPVGLRPAAAQAMALTLHELATNAAKYGALSSPTASLAVQWELSEKELVLTWTEEGGPGILAEPSHHSFGSKAIVASVEQQLGGRVDFAWRREGLSVTLRIPRLHLSEAVGPEKSGEGLKLRGGSGARRALAPGRKILVVEDEGLVALDMGAQLLAAGCEVVGPAAELIEALRLAVLEELDAAVLDRNLGGVTSDPVALVLRERGIPFVFVTGYTGRDVPPGFEGTPQLSKPFDPEELQELLAQEIARSSSAVT